MHVRYWLLLSSGLFKVELLPKEESCTCQPLPSSSLSFSTFFFGEWIPVFDRYALLLLLGPLPCPTTFWDTSQVPETLEPTGLARAQWEAGCEGASCHSQLLTLKMLVPGTKGPARVRTVLYLWTGKCPIIQNQQLQYLKLLTLHFWFLAWRTTLRHIRTKGNC